MFFAFRCSDPGSDSGRAMVVIAASSHDEAVKHLLDHLRELGREDLIGKIQCTDIFYQIDYGVVHSDVERRVDERSYVTDENG